MMPQASPPASPSRLNPVYLARRHGGMAFLLLALGVSLGLAYRLLAQPTLYQSSRETSLAAHPAETAGAFDWEGRERVWSALLSDPEAQTLLDNNLRYVVKLALVHDLAPDPANLAVELARFAPTRVYSADLLPSGRLASLGPILEVSKRDVASNLDFQSLAAIVSDLEPPKAAKSWDFTFFRDGAAEAERGMEAFMIVRPGPEDRFFRVFYHLHALLHPDAGGVSPEEAWRTAVEEVAERLEREGRFSGGGGFGARAQRELARELAAIPALAANRLYRAAAWNRAGGQETMSKRIWADRWSRDVSLTLTRYGAASGVLAIRTELALFPLSAPRDTALTRITPMMAAVLEAFIAARERPEPFSGDKRAEPAAPPSLPEREQAEKPPAPAEPAPEMPAESAAVLPSSASSSAAAVGASEPAHREKLRALEDAVQAARLERDGALRRLEASRLDERRLTLEALSARSRADRLRERYDEASTAPAPTPESAGEEGMIVTVEVAKLLLERDAIQTRLARLLEYCTEEHPFVRQARRELAAVEAMLAEQVSAQPAPAGGATAGNARLSGLRLEWETAASAAAALEERLRRQIAATKDALDMLARLEKDLADREADLSRARETASERREENIKPLPPRIVATETPPPPQPAEPPPPLERRKAVPSFLVFADHPTRLATLRIVPPWDATLAGAILGCLAALAWVVFREALSVTFANAFEARRLVRYPLLASLPAYDVKALRAAAKTVKGDLRVARRGRAAFIPVPVEFAEPPPAARRGAVVPAGRRVRWAAWACGLALLVAGALLFRASGNGFLQPRTAFPGDLALPPASAYDLLDPEDEDGDWGNRP